MNNVIYVGKAVWFEQLKRGFGAFIEQFSDVLIAKFRLHNFWSFFWFTIVASEILTAIMNTIMGIIWWGRFSSDLVHIGSVDAFIVTSLLVPVVFYIIKKSNGGAAYNDRLQHEIIACRQAETALQKISNELELLVEERVSNLKNTNELLQQEIFECRQNKQEKKRLIEELKHLSRTDSLTGLLNRRALMEELDYETDRAQRYGTELSLMLCDIDNFKKINDVYGHMAGDSALKFVSKIFVEVLRVTDMVGRYGGDEFMVVLPETPADGAENLAERIRAIVEEAEIHIPEQGTVKTSISVGIASFNSGQNSRHSLTIIADKALYISKRNGKNRVHVLRDE